MSRHHLSGGSLLQHPGHHLYRSVLTHQTTQHYNLLKIKGHLSIDKTCFSLLVQNTHLHARIQKNFFFGGGVHPRPLMLVLTPSPPSRFSQAPTPETSTSCKSRGTCQKRRHFILLCKLQDYIYPVSIHIYKS